MDLEFKPGDRVRLTRAGVALYGGAWPHFVPQAQGGGTTGTVVFAGERPHKPGAAPRPYFVHWDSGVENSYRMDDLEAAPEERPEELPEERIEPLGTRAGFEGHGLTAIPEEEDHGEASASEASNIIPFWRGPSPEGKD